jgi:amidohydrolase
MLAGIVLAAVMAATPATEIRAAVDALTPRLVETRRDLHRHPELGNRETRTGQLVADRLRQLGLEVHAPVAKTGVVGILKGGRPGPVVGLRADLDALPIQEKNDVPYRSENPGVKHACGHDAHTTIVLGVAEVLAGLRAKLPGTVVFLFQPAEEGPPEGEEGGALLMMKEGALDTPKIGALYGLHMDPLLDVGKVGWASGPIWASTDRFVVTVTGRRSHGGYPHTGLDPVPVAAQIVDGLQLIASRQIDAQKPKVITIGSIHGGNRFNILAEDVTMEGTVRSLDEPVRADIKQRMARTVKGIGEANGMPAALRFVGEGNPVTLNDPPLTRAALPAMRRVFGDAGVVEVAPQMGGEDFAYFAKQVPAAYFKLGVRNESRGITAMIHTEDFDLDEGVLPLGVRAFCEVLWDHQIGRGEGR